MAIDIATRTGAGGARRKTRAVRLSTRDRIALTVMVGVPVFVVGALIWFPTVASIVLSFTNWDGIGGIGTAHWVGTPELPRDRDDLPAVLAGGRGTTRSGSPS